MTFRPLPDWSLFRRPLVRLGVALFLILPAGGCVRDYLARLRGPGFDERSKEFTAEVPQRENAGKSFSFSTKAQEIEQNFGFN